MPILRLAIFIFLTLMLASLTAVASGPVVADKSPLKQDLASLRRVLDKPAEVAPSPGANTPSSPGAQGTNTGKKVPTIPLVGENIPGAGQ